MTTNLNVKSFEVDSSLEFLSDQFSAVLNDSVEFQRRDFSMGVTLTAGLYDENNNPVTYTAIVGAVVDDFSLNYQPNSLEVSIQGRDFGAYLVDRTVRQKYTYSGGISLTQVIYKQVPIVNQFGALITYTQERVGVFSAVQIAQNICSAVGVGLSWGIDNYILLEDFDANGQALELIRTLAAPFNQTVPYKVDMYMSGGTLNVVKRGGFGMSTAFTTTAYDGRIKNIGVTHRRLPFFGIVNITGRPKIGNISDLISITSNTQQTITEDAEGNKTYETTTTLTLMPANVEISSITDIITNGEHVKKEERFNTWPANFLEGPGSIKNPLQTASTVNHYEADESGSLVHTSREEVSMVYDNRFLLSRRATTKYEDGGSGILVRTGVTNESFADVGNGFMRSTTTSLLFDETGTSSVDSHVSTVSGGARPGGVVPYRQRVTVGDAVLDAAFGFEQRIQQISTDPRARDFTYTNHSLALPQVQHIISEFASASGAVETEVNFTAVGMPWLKKGTTLSITQFPYEDGTIITLGPMLIVDVKTSLTINLYVSSIKAVFWTAA